MDLRFNRIVKAKMCDGSISDKLMLESSDDIGISNDFDIEISSDFWFNTQFAIIDVLKTTMVCSLSEVLEYCAGNYIEIRGKRRKEAGILAGGEYDWLLTNDLHLVAIQN